MPPVNFVLGRLLPESLDALEREHRVSRMTMELVSSSIQVSLEGCARIGENPPVWLGDPYLSNSPGDGHWRRRQSDGV